MATVNVNRNVTDQFYRYKMPKIMAKVEGKGNGIKTVLTNMCEVARAIGRPPSYTTKYFGCELGALTRIDVKNDRFIVNGSHDANKLQQLLDGFIRKYVLCKECDNPETVLRVSQKKGVITTSCKACGNHCDVDMTHKLTAFILKNPPDESRKSRNGGGTEASTKDENFDDSPPVERVDDDDDWSVDVSPEAVKRRMEEELTKGVKNLAINDDVEKTEKERIDILYEFIKRCKEGNKFSVAGADKEILQEAERLEVKDKGPLVLAELLLDGNILQQVKQYRLVFLRFCHGNAKAQKYLLGGIEQVIAINKATLLPKAAHILKAFYDVDILEEDILLDWGKKVSKKYVSKEISEQIHAKAAPFLTWLENAEESSSEEDSDDDDDVEIAYDERAIGDKLKIAVKKPESTPKINGMKNGTVKAEREEEDDFDIDAI